ncbi:unnamed protein product [Owenia fusiformis]|uniref:Uncharacterized protein n=1 Tax=Owenia fusiformis TaxID=6347 RepID=A0A8S4Q4D8_OWEFU|nr:unnamed protein product [Owenia fusiformis]
MSTENSPPREFGRQSCHVLHSTNSRNSPPDRHLFLFACIDNRKATKMTLPLRLAVLTEIQKVRNVVGGIDPHQLHLINGAKDGLMRLIEPDTRVIVIEMDFSMTPPPQLRVWGKTVKAITNILDATPRGEKFHYRVEGVSLREGREEHPGLTMYRGQSGLHVANGFGCDTDAIITYDELRFTLIPHSYEEPAEQFVEPVFTALKRAFAVADQDVGIYLQIHVDALPTYGAGKELTKADRKIVERCCIKDPVFTHFVSMRIWAGSCYNTILMSCAVAIAHVTLGLNPPGGMLASFEVERSVFRRVGDRQQLVAGCTMDWINGPSLQGHQVSLTDAFRTFLEDSQWVVQGRYMHLRGTFGPGRVPIKDLGNIQ